MLFGGCSHNREWHNVRVEELKLLYDELLTEAGICHGYSRLLHKSSCGRPCGGCARDNTKEKDADVKKIKKYLTKLGVGF